MMMMRMWGAGRRGRGGTRRPPRLYSSCSSSPFSSAPHAIRSNCWSKRTTPWAQWTPASPQGHDQLLDFAAAWRQTMF